MKLKHKLILSMMVAAVLTGCSSLGKGMVEAFLESRTSVDARLCDIWGQKFDGLRPHLDNTRGKMKLLVVHGVGDHLPGYSRQLMEKLLKEMDLSVMARQQKNITLTDPLKGEKNLGNLRVQRLLNKTRTKELLFYELTWSAITNKQKEVLAYDNSGDYAFRRAQINDLMKRFSNDTGPDPLIYLGEGREDILHSFVQAFCWMTKSYWPDLPNEEKKACAFNEAAAATNLQVDEYAFVSHSLGSRIVIDGLQGIAAILGDQDVSFREALKKKEIPIYMMSNQLPMLQLGRKLPEVYNQHSAYCEPNGVNFGQRLLRKTPIIAFSDPNDILSYAIPGGFVDKYLDSRLCIDVTNVNLNVANVVDAFGLGKLANPFDAHIGYDNDDRVIGLIANGIGNRHVSKIVRERCSWVETID